MLELGEKIFFYNISDCGELVFIAGANLFKAVFLKLSDKWCLFVC